MNYFLFFNWRTVYNSRIMVHKIDLGKYFIDPDGDELKFSATETQHITVDIAGSTAYLIPETGWVGEERVKFLADDGKGGTIQSNTIPLRVQKHIIPIKYQPYIAVLLGILTIILLLYTVRQLKNKK